MGQKTHFTSADDTPLSHPRSIMPIRLHWFLRRRCRHPGNWQMLQCDNANATFYVCGGCLFAWRILK